MLFRKQAWEAKKETLTGDVLLVQPLSLYGISLFFFIFFALTLLYLSQFEFARKETVQGYLAPQQGVITLYSHRPGVISNLWVKEGQKIDKDQKVALIQNRQGLTNGQERTTALLNEAERQVDILNQQQATAIKLFDKEMKTLQQQSQRLEQRIDASNKAKETSLKRLALQAQIFKKKQTLHQNGYLSTTDFLTAQEELLQYHEAIANLDKELAAIRLDLSQIQAQQQLLPDKQNLKQTEIQQKLSLLRAHKIELESQYEVIQKAPKGGIVTAIQSKIGSQISRNTPLLSIIPNDSLLELQLLLPSRSAGFVQNGDNVNIRFDAFPYQKFGIMKGIIIKVDKALILPSDQVLPLEIEQAMYRVTATLAEQSIMAYGENFPLKVGMLVEADIILESRTLLEWLLDPIYALRGKL